MKKKIFLFPNPDFDKKYMGGISRLYQIFCKEYDFNLEIINEDFLKIHKPMENNKDLIVIAGGDGTIHKAINAIPETFFSAYKFGIIPTGTANEFAKSLNLPYFLEDAAYLIANENEKNNIFHKVAIVKDKYKFLTGMLYGVACQVLQSTSQNAKAFWGSFAYNLPGFMSLTNFYDHIKEFKMDSMEFQTGYLIINNASLISKDLAFEDIKDENRDLFSFIYVYPNVTHSDMLWLLVKNQARLNILQDPSIFYTQIEEIHLEFNEKSLFMLDGELYEFSSPINIKHHGNRIEVICA
ncbi:MAG: hypothetical protein A2039_00770 [Candidatus Melainabacteria bacterium GWA2_34_9]|nr:MAG: hypothetical protein A2039_00770 [Candidatus Melainabacteria bacterium GWA2_34_9]